MPDKIAGLRPLAAGAGPRSGELGHLRAPLGIDPGVVLAGGLVGEDGHEVLDDRRIELAAADLVQIGGSPPVVEELADREPELIIDCPLATLLRVAAEHLGVEHGAPAGDAGEEQLPQREAGCADSEPVRRFPTLLGA